MPRSSTKRSANLARTKGKPRIPSHERRQRILEAARAVFIRQGLKGAKTKELAEAAGISEALLFTHFATKEALIEEAILSPLRKTFTTDAKAAFDLDSIDPAGLQTIGRQIIVDGAATMADAFPLLITTLFSDFEQGRSFYNEYLYPEMLERGAKLLMQLFKLDDRENAELLALIGFATTFAVSMDRYFRGPHHNSQDVATLYLRMLSGAFALAEPPRSPKPRKSKLTTKRP